MILFALNPRPSLYAIEDQPPTLSVKRLPLSHFQLYFFILDLLDLGPHPLFDSGFQFCLIASSLQVLNGFASVIQSNEVTRDLIGLMLVGNEINQLAVIT